MDLIKIGFIGFGEVGAVFSEAMNAAGAEIMVYDVLLEQAGKAEDMKRRILATGSRAGSMEEVIAHSDYLLSTVITQVAEEVARRCAKYLKSGQVYLDLNSTSPAVKVDLNRIITPTGAEFVEGAILGAVGATGAKTRILAAGNRGREVADILNRHGLNFSFYSPEIGKASMFKMLRSIFSKGVEIILMEMMVAGRRAGIEKDLWDDITHFMAAKPFDKIGSNWIASHAVAYERRYYEMCQVVETMREIGIQPIVTEGTVKFFQQSLDMKINKGFSEKPDSFYRVIEYIESELRARR